MTTLLLLCLSPAFAADLQTAGGHVTVDGKLIVDLPAAPRSALVVGDRLYILRADGIVDTWQLGAAPALVASQADPEAQGLFEAGGRVWVEEEQTRAVPLGPAGPASVAAAPVAGGSGGQSAVGVVAPTSHAAASVLRVEPGEAVIDGGKAAGFAVGQQVRIMGTVRMVVPSLSGAGSESRDVQQVVAVGRVRVADDDRGLVDLARGSWVHPGDHVEAAPGAYAYPVAPERAHGMLEAGLNLRPLLAIGTVGFAMVDEAWFTAAFDAPWYTTARVTPIAFGWSRDGNPITIAGTASGGFDSRFFSVGLGAGWSMLNLAQTSYAYDNSLSGSGGNNLGFSGVNNAFAFVQEARLGSRDGLNLGVRDTLLDVPVTTYTYDNSGVQTAKNTVREFRFGGIAMDLAVPTGDRTDLFVDWGTGDAGATWAEGGVSTWLRGNGEKGSFGVRVGAGYAQVSGTKDTQTISLSGPMVSVGARARL